MLTYLNNKTKFSYKKEHETREHGNMRSGLGLELGLSSEADGRFRYLFKFINTLYIYASTSTKSGESLTFLFLSFIFIPKISRRISLYPYSRCRRIPTFPVLDTSSPPPSPPTSTFLNI